MAFTYNQVRDLCKRLLRLEACGFTIECVNDLKEWQALHMLPGVEHLLQPVTSYAVQPSSADAIKYGIDLLTCHTIAVTSKEMLESLYAYTKALEAAGFEDGIGFDVDGKHKLCVNHWVLLSGGSRRLHLARAGQRWTQTFTPFIFGVFPTEEAFNILYLMLSLKVSSICAVQLSTDHLNLTVDKLLVNVMLIHMLILVNLRLTC